MKRRGGEETRRRGKEERMRGGGDGAVFFAMQVLEIPAGGRGFPLVIVIGIPHFIKVNSKVIAN